MGELLEQNLFLSLIVEANDTPCIIMVLEEGMVVGEAIIVVISQILQSTLSDEYSWRSILEFYSQTGENRWEMGAGRAEIASPGTGK